MAGYTYPKDKGKPEQPDPATLESIQKSLLILDEKGSEQLMLIECEIVALTNLFTSLIAILDTDGSLLPLP